MTDHSIRPESRFSLSLLQLLALAAFIGGGGFSVGALYPRLLQLEDAVQLQSKALQQVVAELNAHDRRIVKLEGRP